MLARVQLLEVEVYLPRPVRDHVNQGKVYTHTLDEHTGAVAKLLTQLVGLLQKLYVPFNYVFLHTLEEVLIHIILIARDELINIENHR